MLNLKKRFLTGAQLSSALILQRDINPDTIDFGPIIVSGNIDLERTFAYPIIGPLGVIVHTETERQNNSLVINEQNVIVTELVGVREFETTQDAIDEYIRLLVLDYKHKLERAFELGWKA